MHRSSFAARLVGLKWAETIVFAGGLSLALATAAAAQGESPTLPVVADAAAVKGVCMIKRNRDANGVARASDAVGASRMSDAVRIVLPDNERGPRVAGGYEVIPCTAGEQHFYYDVACRAAFGLDPVDRKLFELQAGTSAEELCAAASRAIESSK